MVQKFEDMEEMIGLNETDLYSPGWGRSVGMKIDFWVVRPLRRELTSVVRHGFWVRPRLLHGVLDHHPHRRHRQGGQLIRVHHVPPMRN